MPKICNNCGNQLRDGAKFCPKCGTPVAPIQQSNVSFQPVTAQKPAVPDTNGSMNFSERQNPQENTFNYQPVQPDYNYQVNPNGFNQNVDFQQSAAEPEKKKKNKALIAVIAVIAVLAIAAGGLFAYSKISGKEIPEIFSASDEDKDKEKDKNKSKDKDKEEEEEKKETTTLPPVTGDTSKITDPELKELIESRVFPMKTEVRKEKIEELINMAASAEYSDSTETEFFNQLNKLSDNSINAQSSEVKIGVAENDEFYMGKSDNTYLVTYFVYDKNEKIVYVYIDTSSTYIVMILDSEELNEWIKNQKLSADDVYDAWMINPETKKISSKTIIKGNDKVAYYDMDGNLFLLYKEDDSGSVYFDSEFNLVDAETAKNMVMNVWTQ